MKAFTVVMGIFLMGTPLGESYEHIRCKPMQEGPIQYKERRTVPRPWILSRRIRAARVDTSSLEPMEAPCLDEDESDTPDAPMPAPERLRVTGRGMLASLGLPPELPFTACVDESDVERPCPCVAGGMTKRSATERGGERGREVRRGKLPGEAEMLSRCWFLTRVGVKSGPSSRDNSREDKSDSTVSSRKSGTVRYVTEMVRSPLGCVIGGSACCSCCSGRAAVEGLAPGHEA